MLETTDCRIGLTQEALAETLRRYPGTDPAALVFFVHACGLCAGQVIEADVEWARRVRDGLAATEG